MYAQTANTPPPPFPPAAATPLTAALNGLLTDIYYPDPSGFEDRDIRLPVALFLQGLNVDKAHYSRFARRLARYGFIVVVPNHLTHTFGRAELFARMGQIPRALAALTAGDRDDIPLSAFLDPHKLALIGHSQGGFTGLDAIRGACDVPFCVGDYALPEELAAAVFFGAFLSEDGKYHPANNRGLPIAVMGGSNDSLVGPEETRQTYRAIARPKLFVEVIGANHYGIADRNNPFGAPPEPSRPQLEGAAAIQTIARWSGLFLRAHVWGDHAAREYVYRTGDRLDRNVRVAARP